MKKLITICLMMAMGFASNAQQLSNYYDAVSDGRSGFSYTITVRIQKKSDNTYTATLLQVTPDSKGYYDALSGKLYTCSQLGNVCQPNNFGRLSITIRYESNGQEQVAGVFSFTGVNETVPLGMAITKGAIDGKPSDASNFKLELMGGTLTVSHTTKISDKISKLNNLTSTPTTSQATRASSDVVQDFSSRTNSDGVSPSYQYVPKYTKQDVTNEIIAAATPVVTELVNQWNANYDRKQEKQKAEQHEYYKNLFEKRRDKFKEVYLPLKRDAIGGNIHARLILYFASEQLNASQLLPEGEKWFQDALESNNQDALLYQNYQKSREKLISFEESSSTIIKIAEMGNVDALVQMGGYHSLKIGENPHPNATKALEYYNTAAENGSAVAMYRLGMIYKYGTITDVDKRWYVSFKNIVRIDEKIAFDWFKKVLEANHQESIYMRADYRDSLYTAIKDTYYQLSKIYKDGKVVPQDKAKAKELAEYANFDYILSQKYSYMKD